MGDLEARIRRLEDRAELQELIARYANAIDDRDMDTVLGCFCADATVGRADGSRTGRGHDGIRDFYAGLMRDMALTVHVPHTQVLDFTDDAHATGVVQCHAEMAINGTYVLAALRYHDAYRRDDGRWKFASREMHFFYFMDVTELPTHAFNELRVRWPGDPVAAQIPEQSAHYQRRHEI